MDVEQPGAVLGVEPDVELVRRLTDELHQGPTGGTGFAVLPGIQGRITDPEDRKAFTVALTMAIWDEMLARGWTNLADDDVRLNVFEANDGSLPIEIVGDNVTYKKLHFDPHSIVFAHLYEAPRNVTGGALTFVDVRGYLDAEDLALDEVFRPSSRPGHERRLVAQDHHRTQLLEGFGTRVEPPYPGETLLVLVRNDPVVGVAHEISPVRCVDPAWPTERRFLRASVAPHH